MSFLFGVTFSDDADAFDPLLIGDEEDADVTGGGGDFLDRLGVFILLFETDAWACIDAELDHEKAVIEQVVAELGSGTAFGIGHDWQIKHGEEPSHTKGAVVHRSGLGGEQVGMVSRGARRDCFGLMRRRVRGRMPRYPRHRVA